MPHIVPMSRRHNVDCGIGLLKKAPSHFFGPCAAAVHYAPLLPGLSHLFFQRERPIHRRSPIHQVPRPLRFQQINKEQARKGAPGCPSPPRQQRERCACGGRRNPRRWAVGRRGRPCTPPALLGIWPVASSVLQFRASHRLVELEIVDPQWRSLSVVMGLGPSLSVHVSALRSMPPPCTWPTRPEGGGAVAIAWRCGGRAGPARGAGPGLRPILHAWGSDGAACKRPITGNGENNKNTNSQPPEREGMRAAWQRLSLGARCRVGASGFPRRKIKKGHALGSPLDK
jgi:hypothetical protein